MPQLWASHAGNVTAGEVTGKKKWAQRSGRVQMGTFWWIPNFCRVVFWKRAVQELGVFCKIPEGWFQKLFKFRAKVCTFVLNNMCYSILFHVLQVMSSKLSMAFPKPQCSFSSSQLCFGRPQLISLWSFPFLKCLDLENGENGSVCHLKAGNRFFRS